VAALPRRRMWRGKGLQSRHAARRDQRGHRVKKIFARLFLKIKFKKFKIKKLPPLLPLSA
jgi:hypothetical protein